MSLARQAGVRFELQLIFRAFRKDVVFAERCLVALK